MKALLDNPEFIIVTTILTVAGVFELLEFTGFMPEKVARWIARNRSRPTLNVLRELGVDVDSVRRVNVARSIPKFSTKGDKEQRVREALKAITLNRGVEVGSINRVPAKSFIDLMGASTSPQHAKLFAAVLADHWRSKVEKGDGASNPIVDFIVTPKRGSPILGYELAQLLKRPLALHLSDPKFRSSGAVSLEAQFDVSAQLEPGARALIVDDSTTGGDKVARAIEDLRAHGFVVSDCLVVFEPTVKDARSKLNQLGIRLHSVVTISA